MTIVGKGSKERQVEPPVSLLLDTYEYLRLESHGGTSRGRSSYVFTTKDQKALTQNWVSKRFAWFFQIAGFDSHLHRARAYYLFQLVRARVRLLAKHGKLDELQVRTILKFVLDRAGHEDLATLEHYVDMNMMDLGVTLVRA